MRRTMWATAALLAVCVAGAAQSRELADMRGMFAISAGGGVGFPIGDYKDLTKTGPAGEFAVEYYVTRSIALGLRGAGMVGDLADEFQSPGYSLSSSMGVGGVSMRFSLPTEMMEPYVLAMVGTGQRSLQAVTDNSTVTVSNDRLGFGAMGGVNFNVSRSWQVTSGVGYLHAAKDSNDDTDFRWQAVHLAVGARWLLGGRS